MDQKEKIKKLTRYLASLESKDSSHIPEKHVLHPKEYKQFIEREMTAVKRQISDLTLENVEKK